MAESTDKKGGSGAMGFIVVALLLVLIGGGAGAGFGLAFLNPDALVKGASTSHVADPADKGGAKDAKGKGKDGKDHTSEKENPANAIQVVGLDPIFVTLAGSQKMWVRLELAVVFATPSKEDRTLLLRKMAEDVMVFMRTVPMSQIETASGLEYLKEDLSELVQLRSQGSARGIVFKAFMVE